MLDSTGFCLFTERLDAAGIKYMVTGSVAVIVYGEPRLTHDIDMIIELKRKDIPALIEAFPDEEFYCPPSEVITVEILRSTRGHFNIIHHESGFKADIYPVGNDSFIRWGLDHASEYDVSGTTMKVAPAEYVIVKKLEFFREGHSHKHLCDIAGMLDYASNLIDREMLLSFIKRFGLENEWRQATELSEERG
jgi:hypothetical protein